MKLNEIYVGQRVIAVEATDGNNNIIHKSGTVEYITESRTPHVGVNFDVKVNGHTLDNNKAKEGHGWNCLPHTLQPFARTEEELLKLLLNKSITSEQYDKLTQEGVG